MYDFGAAVSCKASLMQQQQHRSVAAARIKNVVCLWYARALGLCRTRARRSRMCNRRTCARILVTRSPGRSGDRRASRALGVMRCERNVSVVVEYEQYDIFEMYTKAYPSSRVRSKRCMHIVHCENMVCEFVDS